MSFSVEKNGTVTVVRVVENITFVNQREFVAVWDRLLGDGCQAAVLDLSGITYFGSMAVGLVAKVFNQLKSTGARLVAVRPEREDVFQVFKITRMTDLIRFFDSRAAALEALGVREGEVKTLVVEEQDPVGAKIAKLSDPDPEVRRYTAWALGLLGDDRAVAALEGVLRDPDLRVRETAAESLEKLTGKKIQLPGQ